MNRKKKSSVILIIVFCVVSPLIYLLYQWTTSLDEKLFGFVEKSQVIFDNERQKIKDTLIGTEWINEENPSEKWEFPSDSVLVKNNIAYKIQMELNVIIIQEEEPVMLMCIIDNPSSLRISYVKTDFTDFFDGHDFFTLKKVTN